MEKTSGKSVSLKVAIWADGDTIHLASSPDENGADFHASIKEDGPSGHSSLFGQLSKILEGAGKPTA